MSRPSACWQVIKGRRLDRVIRQVFPNAQVIRVDPKAGVSATHVALAARGPFDVLVDDTARQPGQEVKRFRATFGHVARGGVLVMRSPLGRRGTGDGGPTWRAGRESAALPLPAPGGAGRRSEPGSRLNEKELVLAKSLGRVEFNARHVIVGMKTGSLAKLREDEMNRVLELRDGQDARLLVPHPSQEFRSMCTLRENIEGFNPRMQETYVAPLVSLREYDNVICVPGQVAVQGNLLLPDSYRHNQQKHLNNRHTD